MSSSGQISKDLPPQKRRWGRLALFAVILLILVGSISALLLRSQWGLRTVVIPYLAKRAGCSLQLASPALSWDGVLTGENARVKMTDSTGAVWLVANMPQLTWDLWSDVPSLAATHCDLEVLRLPHPTGGGGTFDGSSNRIPRLSIDIDQLDMRFPEFVGFGGVPALALRSVQVKGDGVQLVTKVQGTTDFSDCRSSLQWLNRTNVVFDVNVSSSDAGLRWVGAFALSNSFETAPLPELESASIQCDFDLTEMGPGRLALKLKGQEYELLNLAADVEPGTVKRRVNVDMGGPALSLPAGMDGMKLNVQAWHSRFRMNWNIQDVSFDGIGAVEFPGVTVELPHDGGSLPPIKLRGNWALNKTPAGKYLWSGKADLKKGDTSLLYLRLSSQGDAPVYLNLPSRPLSELRPYLKPLGITLPDGKVGGRLSLTANDKGGYDGKMALKVSELVVDSESGDTVNLDLDLGGTLVPKESLDLNQVHVKGSLLGGEGTSRHGDFELRLNQASTIFFDARDRLDFPGKVSFGLEMNLRDPKRVPGGYIRIRGRTGIHLLEAPECWFELLGDYRGRSFLQAAAEVLINKDWSLKHLELTNFSVHNYTKTHATLLSGIFNGELKGLSANGVFKQEGKKRQGLYEFSGNVRCTGLRTGIVPDGPGLSKTFQASGSLDLKLGQLEVSKLLASGRIPASPAHPAEATYVLTSKGKMVARWRPRLYFRMGQLEFASVLPASYLPNFRRGHRNTPLRLRALLSAESGAEGRYATALSVSSSFGGKAVGELNLTGNFTNTGKIRSIDLKRGVVSIPEDLAELLGGWCPQLENATCAGLYANGAFKFSGGTTSVRRLAILPPETTASCAYSITGTHSKDLTRIQDSWFSLVCNLPKEPGCLNVNAKFEAPGLVNWRPRGIADLTLPLTVDLYASPTVLAWAEPLAGVRKPLTSVATVTVTLDGARLNSAIGLTAKVGKEPVALFQGNLATSKLLKPKTFRIRECRIFNRQGVNLAALSSADDSWNELHLGGRYSFDDRAHKGFLKVVGFSRPGMGRVPWNLTLSGTGVNSAEGEFRLKKASLSCLSKSSSGDTSRITAKVEGHLKLARNRPSSLRFVSFFGAASLDGSVPAAWLGEACGERSTNSKDTLVVKGLADVTTELVSLKLNGAVGESPVLVLGGNLGLSGGRPVTGSIDARASSHEVIGPLLRRFGIHGFESAKASFNARARKGVPSFDLTWSAKNGTLFPTNAPEDRVNVAGNLRGRFGHGATPGSIRVFNHTMAVGNAGHDCSVELQAPIMLGAKPEAKVAISVQLPERFVLKWLRRPVVESEAQYSAAGTLKIKGGNAWSAEAVGTVMRDQKEVAALDGIVDWDAAGRLSTAVVRRFVLKHDEGLDRLHPACAAIHWKTLALDGRVAAKGRGYESAWNGSLTEWRPSWAASSCSIDSRATVKATANAQFVCAIREFEVANDVSDLDRKKKVGNLAASLSGPGVFTPLDDRPVGRGKLDLSGAFDGLPGVEASMTPSTVKGTVEVLAGKTRFSTAAVISITDASGPVARLKAALTRGWDLGLQDLKVQELKLARRPWILALAPATPDGWDELSCTGVLAKNPKNGALAGDWRIDVAGVTLDPWSATECSATTTVLLGKQGPTLTQSTITVTGKDSVSGKPAYGCRLKQGERALTFDHAPLAETDVGEWAFEGDLGPPFLATVFGGQALPKGVPFRGRLSYDGTKGKADAILFYDKGEILRVQPEYDRTERFFGLKLKAQRFSDDLAKAIGDARVVPDFKTADLTVTVRARKNGVWAIYAKTAAEGLRDRNGWMEKGDFGLDAQFDVTSSETGWVSSAPFPVATTWNGKPAFDATLDGSFKNGKGYNFYVKNASLPLTTLFEMLNRRALSPRVVCTGGKIAANLSCGFSENGWVANSIFKLDAASFEEKIGAKQKLFDFSWDLVLNGSGKPQGDTYVSVKANGPGWGNEAELRLAWAASQAWPAGVKLKGGSVDLSNFHRVFRRDKRFAVSNKAGLDLLALVPELNDLRAFGASYSAQLDGLTIGPVDMDDVDLRFLAKNGRLDLSSSSLKLNGTKIEGTGFLDATGAKASGMIDVKGGTSLRPLFAFLYDGEDAEDIDGKLEFAFRAEGAGADLKDVATRAEGKGAFTVKSFSFYQLPGLKQAAKDMMIEGFDRLEFEQINSKLSLEKGVVMTRDLVCSRSEMELTLQAARNLDGSLVIRDVDLDFSMAHQTKVVGKRLVASIGSGWDALSTDRNGYVSFRLPFIFVRNAGGWTANTVDSTVAKPFKDSTLGAWLTGLFKSDGGRPTSP